MNYNPKYHHRKSIRLMEYDYANPNWYYVTICTKNKECLFGKIKDGRMILNDFGNIVGEELLKTKEIRKNVDIDYYVIMPNHIHAIIIIEYKIESNQRWDKARLVPTMNNDDIRKFGNPIANSLASIIGSFKSAVTKRINEHRNTPGGKVWQSNYYEHIIRNEKDLFHIRKYIEQNPLKWELDEYYKK
jgi:putative transposase